MSEITERKRYDSVRDWMVSDSRWLTLPKNRADRKVLAPYACGSTAFVRESREGLGSLAGPDVPGEGTSGHY